MSSIRLSALAVAAAFLPGLASAEPIATITAAFDPFLQNTFFDITNNTADNETNLLLTTSLGPTTSVSLPDLAAGATYTYYFNQVNGGFLVGAGNNNVPDTTTYQLSLVDVGSTESSNVFSPASNLTGVYVDFLGNTCYGFSNGCPVATTGTVAAVPEPGSGAMLIGMLGSAAGLIGLRRRVR
jgi:hypothetical protein